MFAAQQVFSTAQQLLQAGLGVGAHVVAGSVHHIEHNELVGIATQVQQVEIVLAVVGKREGGGRRQGAHRAPALEALAFGLQALQHLEGKLGVHAGETTADGVFTLQPSECQGACADAPVMLVNDRHMCSFMSHDKLDQLIDSLRGAAKA